MSIRIVTHTNGRKCVLDTETSEYYFLPDTRNKFFAGGYMFDFCDTIYQFIGKGIKSAIVPVFCVKTGKKGKRIFCELISGINEYSFSNVERIGSRWEPNKIESISPGKAYFLFLEKNKGAINDLIIKSAKEIVKGEY